MEKKKNLLLIISIIAFVLVLTGGTYAWLTFNQTSVGNNVIAGTSTCYIINYNYDNDDGTTELGGTLFQSSTHKGGLSGKVTMSVNDECDVCTVGKIFLRVNNTTSPTLYSKVNKAHCEDPTTLKTMTGYTTSSSCTSAGYSWVNNVSALKYAVYEDINSNPLSVGYIDGVKDMTIYSDFGLSTSPRNFYVYVWLDGELANNNYLNVSFDGDIHLGAEQTEECDIEGSANAPVLDNTGMIPVTIANDGTVTTVSKTDSSWYNYDNKQWANAVLVKQNGTKTRSYYLSNTNVEVNQNDILAYYVWIPKYKYKIWLKDGTTTSSPQEIDIVFEAKGTVTTGSEVGDYMTHPAFNFGGQNLSGIWVGKFETSASPDSDCFKTPSTTSCNNMTTEPRILPGVNALAYQYVGNLFMTALKFSGGTMDSTSGVVTFAGSTTFGLANTTNSHMMKNSEWGAVAYLSHSKYGTCTNGICSEIRLNNYWSSPKSETGCGAATSTTTDIVTDCAIPYGGAASYPQSTTGNISGVFDMSGGLMEYVMGNYNNTSSTTNFAKLPESKYYDVYLIDPFDGNSSTNMSKCTLTTCGGHALFETAGWYSDDAFFVLFTGPWFLRGGDYYYGFSSGAFKSSSGNGTSLYYSGFRSVLVANGA